MTHKIDEHVLNSNLDYCISEYVRLVEHREILREWWFLGKTLEELSASHHIGMTSLKSIIYGEGDKILLRASEMSQMPVETQAHRRVVPVIFVPNVPGRA